MRTRRSKSAALVASFFAVLSLAGSGDAPAAALGITVPISGTVDGGPESVLLSGSLSIASTLVDDPVLTTPKERITIKLVNVSGIGLMSGANYVATGEDRLMRLLSVSNHIDVMFPFYATADGPGSARSAMVSITLNFDLVTGSLTDASAAITSPKLPN